MIILLIGHKDDESRAAEVGGSDGMKHIVLIDDEEMVLEAVGRILTIKGFAVTSFSDSVVGESYAMQNEFDLMVLDVRMPKRTGVEVAVNILERRPDARILITTGQAEDAELLRAVRAGVCGILQKPFEIDDVVDYLAQVE